MSATKKIPEFSDFESLLRYVISEYKKEIFKDKERVENILNDLSREKFEKERKILKDAYYFKAVDILLNVGDNADDLQRRSAVNSAKSKLTDKAGLSETSAESFLKDFCGAIGWDISEVMSSNKGSEQVNPTQTAAPLKEETAYRNAELQNPEPRDTERKYSEPLIPPYENTRPTVSEVHNSPSSYTLPAEKKKSPLKYLFIIALVAAAFVMAFNFGKKNGTGDDITVGANVSNNDISSAAPEAETQAPQAAEAIPSETASPAAADTAANADITAADIAEADVAAPNADARETAAAYSADDTSEALGGGAAETVFEPDVYDTSMIVTEDESAYTSQYTVVNIADANWNSKYSNAPLMTYDDKKDILYYVDFGNDLYSYDFSNGSTALVLKYDDLVNKAAGNDESSNSLKPSGSTNKNLKVRDIKRVIYNKYNGKLYIYGTGLRNSLEARWFYDVNDNTFTLGERNAHDIAFISENEYSSLNFFNGTAYVINYGTKKTTEADIGSLPSGYSDTYIFDINDNYYALAEPDYSSIDSVTSPKINLYRIGNPYSPNYEELGELLAAPKNPNMQKYICYGADTRNNKIYFRDTDNNIFEIDVEKLTKDKYIPIDDVRQTGKASLGNNSCIGLIATKNGSFVTYDTSDGKIKCISAGI